MNYKKKNNNTHIFEIKNEGHTLGNILQPFFKQKFIKFGTYTQEHPSIQTIKILLRLYDNNSQICPLESFSNILNDSYKYYTDLEQNMINVLKIYNNNNINNNNNK